METNRRRYTFIINKTDISSIFCESVLTSKLIPIRSDIATSLNIITSYRHISGDKLLRKIIFKPDFSLFPNWSYLSITCAGNWLRTITSDQTVHSNSSLSFWTRQRDITGQKLLKGNKFTLCFAYFVSLKCT